MNNIGTEQLSLFAIKPTTHIRNQSPGQLMLDIMEISMPPKHLIAETREK